MITLIISACLLSNVNICRDHRIPLTAEVSTVQCLFSAQLQIARWSEEHPQWKVVRWRCRPANEDDI
ncbi:MAG: hypothetical protein DIU63_06135 [Proteobacteria bacterium]|jgi:acyl-ACP thioesterase|nr:MAG: hypothetical protein DIU63_06135 [Pseudomonadota bacterium]